MTVRKVVAGSVLVAGVGVAGILGAGSAAAAPAPNQPGVSVSVNGGPAVGFGDAHAKSSTGSAAVAINLNAPAKASAFGKGNTALAVGVLGPSLAEAVGHTTRRSPLWVARLVRTARTTTRSLLAVPLATLTAKLTPPMTAGTTTWSPSSESPRRWVTATSPSVPAAARLGTRATGTLSPRTLQEVSAN